MGIVRDEKGIEEIGDEFVDRIAQLDANTRLAGHESGSASDYVKGWTDELDDKLADYIRDENGQWRLSDYGMDKLRNLAWKIKEAQTPEEKLLAIDMVLNVAHQRSDLSKMFIEGGRGTLDELSGNISANPDIRGSGAMPMLGGMAGGAGIGATGGALVGDTPEERKRNAGIGTIVGMLGGTAGAGMASQLMKSGEIVPAARRALMAPLKSETGAVGYSPGKQAISEGLIPALRDPKTGNVFSGIGHKEILMKVARDDKDAEQRLWGELFNDNTGKYSDAVGFIDKSGKFISRANAERRMASPSLVQRFHSESGAVGAGGLPQAKETVDGLVVRKGIPNTSSIESSLTDYKVQKGVREVPLSSFGLTGKSYSTTETDRIKKLADQIRTSGEINPIIVVRDKDGYYILEGGHRAEALYLLGKKSAPALVVDDLQSLGTSDIHGSGAVPMLGGMAGGAGIGATGGAMVGDTPEERRRNAGIGAIVGMLGGTAGATLAAKLMGDAEIVPAARRALMAQLKSESGQIGAYHGGPHRFDKFGPLEKVVGTGEGAQAFGYGLYFTSEKDIAKYYADNVLDSKKIKDINSQMSVIAKKLQKYEIPGKYGEYRDSEGVRLKKEYDALMDKKMSMEGNVYTVTLHKGKTPDQYDYLKWDEPVSEQVLKKVADAAKKQWVGHELATTGNLERYSFKSYAQSAWNLTKSAAEKMKRKWGGGKIEREPITGQQLYRYLANDFGGGVRDGDKAASDFLLRAGIDGIDYPAGTLSGVNSKARNYVVFDPNAVTIETVNDQSISSIVNTLNQNKGQ